jgi:thousand and one amino acid protein kinase
MEAHRKMLDSEYENLLQQFSKELEKLQARHQQELDRKVSESGSAGISSIWEKFLTSSATLYS